MMSVIIRKMEKSMTGLCIGAMWMIYGLMSRFRKVIARYRNEMGYTHTIVEHVIATGKLI
jgi:hypothetical protein